MKLNHQSKACASLDDICSYMFFKNVWNWIHGKENAF